MEITRQVTTAKHVDRVFDYLGDFTTTTDWDPGTVVTTLEAGDGGVNTRYRNVSRFLGRQTELTYVVEGFEPGRMVRLRGENASVVAVDTMTFAPTPSGGTTVTYSARFSFKGVTRLAAPMLAPAFRRLGNEAERGLQQALDRL
ncbi:MAG: SRPBCC family protein [Candidatus Nanopelagicales bacterium]